MIQDQHKKSGLSGNRVHKGDVPPVIVRVSSPENGRANLRVLLDGHDDYWATSRVGGDEPAQWSWPTRD